MTRRKLQYTLEDVANKLEWKNFIYKTQEQKQRDIQDLVYNIVYLKISGEDGIGRADEARRIADSGDFSMLSADIQKEINTIIDSYANEQNEPHDRLAILLDNDTWSQDKINARIGNLYANAAEIDLIHKWLFSKPSNGKDNLYSAFSKYYTGDLLAVAITPFLYTMFMSRHTKRTQKQYFELVKQTIINRLSRSVKPGIRDRVYYHFRLSGHGEEKEYRAALADIIQKLNGITYADVSYHKTNKLKIVQAEVLPPEHYCLTMPKIYTQFLALTHVKPQQKDGYWVYDDGKQDFILATVRLYPNLGALFDKYMRLLIAFGTTTNERLLKSDGRICGKKTTLMSFAGYSQEQVKDYDIVRNFNRNLKAFVSMCAGDNEVPQDLLVKSKNPAMPITRVKELVKNQYDDGYHYEENTNMAQLGFLAHSSEITSTTFDLYLDPLYKTLYFSGKYSKAPYSSIAFLKIPIDDWSAYFTYLKLEQLYGMKNNIAKNREAIASVATLIANLQCLNIIKEKDEKRYKQLVADKVLRALNRLQDKYEIITYYFYQNKDKEAALSDDEVEKLLNKENFTKLMISFDITGELEDYLDKHKEEFVNELQEAAAKKKTRKGKKNNHKKNSDGCKIELPKATSPFEMS